MSLAQGPGQEVPPCGRDWAATPWLLRFAGDRVALLDVTIGGLIVVLLGAPALTCAPSEHAVAGRHPSH